MKLGTTTLEELKALYAARQSLVGGLEFKGAIANDFLAIVAALEAGEKFRAAYEAVDQDQNEETEQALLDALANYDKVTK